MEKVEVYKVKDGTQFDNDQEALKYERTLDKIHRVAIRILDKKLKDFIFKTLWYDHADPKKIETGEIIIGLMYERMDTCDSDIVRALLGSPVKVISYNGGDTASIEYRYEFMRLQDDTCDIDVMFLLDKKDMYERVAKRHTYDSDCIIRMNQILNVQAKWFDNIASLYTE